MLGSNSVLAAYASIRSQRTAVFCAGMPHSSRMPPKSAVPPRDERDRVALRHLSSSWMNSIPSADATSAFGMLLIVCWHSGQRVLPRFTGDWRRAPALERQVASACGRHRGSTRCEPPAGTRRGPGSARRTFDWPFWFTSGRGCRAAHRGRCLLQPGDHRVAHLDPGHQVNFLLGGRELLGDALQLAVAREGDARPDPSPRPRPRSCPGAERPASRRSRCPTRSSSSLMPSASGRTKVGVRGRP